MEPVTLIFIALALAMDAFAVALAAGVALHPVSKRQLFRLGFHFGLFQGLMPIIGWLAGLGVQGLISAYDHWLAFGLLSFVGGKMIFEAFQDDEEKQKTDPTKGATMVMLSIATSIDALAVGLSLAVIGVNIWTPALVIAVTAATLTVAGMLLGGKIGMIWGKRVEVLGGLLLIGIGLKILVDHLGQ
ncbi:MAG: manganese efflux pump MntP family protein [Proteobacteria bacterium]|nr:manganese efflux pump MntP family protein [Pseudomonadota bacterium]MBU4294503.1 manganese efflux pump MntP family protein [Pseudomonadota bacterium]MCG2747039.1 manganese efflux pump MntP family protein [Desulfobulbaceae bacterium]